MSDSIKSHLYSAAHTFITVFLVSFTTAITMIPADSFFSPATWTVAAISGLVGAAVRAAIKAVSMSLIPSQTV